ncbi:MAG: CoA-binding protein [Bacteroidota bacterium]
MKKEEHKKTVVIGASLKPYRYSHTAVEMLSRFRHPVVAVGLRQGKIGEVEVETGRPEVKHVHTVTMYIGPDKQPMFYDYILDTLQPKRIIFNPGTENPELWQMAQRRDIEVVENCTLMMLSHGMF